MVLMELEKIILGEVTQARKTSMVYTHSEGDISYKVKDNNATIHKPKETK